jgi:hypothetical protein
MCSSCVHPQNPPKILKSFGHFQTYGLALLPPVSMVYFIVISLILGCGHQVSDMEASMHGVCLEEVSHLMTPKAGPSTQKSHHCDICGPVLKGILHLASPLVQKLYMTRACTNTPQNHHTAGNPLKKTHSGVHMRSTANFSCLEMVQFY